MDCPPGPVVSYSYIAVTLAQHCQEIENACGMSMGYAVAQLVEAQRYKSEGRGLVKLCFSLLHGYHPNPATPKLQHTSKQEHTTNVVIR